MVKMSIVAASLIATTAMAADKGIDITTTGQAVVYYQTLANNGAGAPDLFDQATGRANVGIQLNLDADLKNGFTFGSTINYLGTLGLEKNIVSGTMQNTNGGIAENNIADDIYLSQLYIAKKIANTTVKLGRQELPQSLSPFAYSEGWSVFKNTFDAALVVNTDIPDTTLVGAYVSKGNFNAAANADMSSYGDLSTTAGAVNSTAYMVTAQNKSIPVATLTGTYYSLSDVAGVVDADVLWGDVAIASKDLPLGLNFGIQGGSIMPDSGLKDTDALGLKAGMKIDALSLTAAYTTVNDGAVGIRNTGGIKTPLYTQMILNQTSLYLDNDTYMLKVAYSFGEAGTLIAQGAITDDKSVADRDLTDLELVYKVKAGGVDFLAAYVNQSWDAPAGAADGQDLVRVVARYNF
jgi:hypothetical protein